MDGFGRFRCFGCDRIKCNKQISRWTIILRKRQYSSATNSLTKVIVYIKVLNEIFIEYGYKYNE